MSSKLPEAKTGWIAGIIDGEGTISVQYSKTKGLWPFVSVGNHSYKMITELMMLCPILIGHSGNVQESAERGAWWWRLVGKPAVQFCHEIEPYLIVKQQQAALVRQFYLSDAHSGSRLTQQEKIRRLALAKAVRLLNHSRFDLPEEI